MKKIHVLVIAAAAAVPGFARGTLFDFDNAPLHSPLPISLTVGGISATFTATGAGFSIQRADVLGFTPVGFSGYCVDPSSVFAADLNVAFDQSLYDFSILYAPEEYACNSSATMKVTAYMNGAPVGSNTAVASPGTWPTQTLSFSSDQPFNSVVVHYQSPPPTPGGDWGPIFMADNMNVVNQPHSQWMLNGDGSWSEASNWNPVGAPNAVAASAIFANAITAPRTVTIDGAPTVGRITFNNANRYTLAGTNSITLDAGGSATIEVLSGSHTIAAPVFLASSTTVSVASGKALTLSGDLNGAFGAGLTKTGSGRLEIKNIHAQNLAIDVGSVKVLPGGAGASNITTLSLVGTPGDWMSTLDLSNNALVIDYTSTGTSPLPTIFDQLKVGRDGGGWTGPGINSSTAAAIAAGGNLHKTALGYAEAADLGRVDFRGEPVSSAVFVAYAYLGDANLDGVVNALDFNALASNFGGASGNLWSQGDFNYDGTVNALDFNALATMFGTYLAPPDAASPLQSVTSAKASVHADLFGASPIKPAADVLDGITRDAVL
jgi:hypothetical protein